MHIRACTPHILGLLDFECWVSVWASFLGLVAWGFVGLVGNVYSRLGKVNGLYGKAHVRVWTQFGKLGHKWALDDYWFVNLCDKEFGP